MKEEREGILISEERKNVRSGNSVATYTCRRYVCAYCYGRGCEKCDGEGEWEEWS